MNDDRPLVTFALFAYNQERFIAEAVRGALSQTYSPLEIIISDDCSADLTFKIIQEQVAEYSGPHEVRLNRNERNIGFGAHINKVMEMTRGTFIVAAAGDDVSLPDRVERLYSAYDRSGGKVTSAFTNAIVIDEFGNREGVYLHRVDAGHLTLEYLAKHTTGALGCAHAWDRRVFDLFGPIDEEVIQEDVVISFRSALIGKVEFINEAPVLYRRHGNNIHFKEPEDVEGPAAFYALLQKGIDNKIAIYTNRLKDLNRARQIYPDRRGEISALQKITLRMLREMKDEKSLMSRPNFFRRIGIIGRATWQGTPPRRIIRWVLTYFFPHVYLSYLRRLRAKLREANPAGPRPSESDAARVPEAGRTIKP